MEELLQSWDTYGHQCAGGYKNPKQEQTKEDYFKAHYNQIDKNQWARLIFTIATVRRLIMNVCIPIRPSADFSAETLQTMQEWVVNSKYWKETLPTKNAVPRKAILQKWTWEKYFPDKQKPSDFSNKTVLQEVLKGVI